MVHRFEGDPAEGGPWSRIHIARGSFLFMGFACSRASLISRPCLASTSRQGRSTVDRRHCPDKPSDESALPEHEVFISEPPGARPYAQPGVPTYIPPPQQCGVRFQKSAPTAPGRQTTP